MIIKIISNLIAMGVLFALALWVKNKYGNVFKVEDEVLKRFNQSYHRDPTIDEMVNILKEVKSNEIAIDEYEAVFKRFVK